VFLISSPLDKMVMRVLIKVIRGSTVHPMPSKRNGSPENEHSVIIYSLSSRSKLVFFAFAHKRSHFEKVSFLKRNK